LCWNNRLRVSPIELQPGCNRITFRNEEQEVQAGAKLSSDERSYLRNHSLLNENQATAKLNDRVNFGVEQTFMEKRLQGHPVRRFQIPSTLKTVAFRSTRKAPLWLRGLSPQLKAEECKHLHVWRLGWRFFVAVENEKKIIFGNRRLTLIRHTHDLLVI
jgi:hypothetical protein